MLGHRVVFEDGKEGWVVFRYEKLPNFCYWCGLMNHDEKDCDCWIYSKGTLAIEIQEFGAWLQAPIFNYEKKIVVIVEGSGEEVYGSHSRKMVARAINVSSMDIDGETIKPSSMEIQNFSKEGLTTVPLIVPPISKKIPDLVEVTHSLTHDNSHFSSTSFET